jgi:hypothetical protein
VSVAVQAVLGVQADSAAQADSSQAVRWAQESLVRDSLQEPE